MRWKRRPDGSNWGEFGENDQIGKMNYLTPALRKEAIKEVVEGIAFCLSLPLDYPGGSELIKTRHEPRLFSVKRSNGHMNYHFPWRTLTCNCDHNDVTSDDGVVLYTQYSTQWDALGHYGQFFDADDDGEPEKVYYNGYRAGVDIKLVESEDEPAGADALGIENLAQTCAQGRGTLINLHSEFGNERVPVGYDQLMQIIDKQKVDVRRGDFLCVYTGFDNVLLGMQKKPEPRVLHKSCAGLNGYDEKLLQWITDSGVVALCSDNTAVEVFPKVPPEGAREIMPLHAHCLFKQGIHLGELWYLSDLARWLHENDRTSFFLTAPPLRLPRAVGSPLMPVATV